MPNYCDNYVTFYGDQKDLEIINERFKLYDEHDYFTNFAEMVLGKPITDSINFESAYTYGTKWWDFEELELKDGYLIIQGSSAWSPPLRLIAEITKVFNRSYCVERVISDINDEVYELDYAEEHLKQHLTDEEWNEVLTETNNK